jgi:hypothetical protein
MLKGLVAESLSPLAFSIEDAETGVKGAAMAVLVLE